MGLEIRMAKTEEELERIFRLRYQVYHRVGFTPENPQGILKDNYDQFSTNFYALRTQTHEVVGAVRLVHQSEIGLPCEELFDLSFLKEKGGGVGEGSMRVTLPNHSQSNYLLIHAVLYYMDLLGLTYLVAMVDPEHLDFYYKLGMHQYGEIKYYEKVDMPAAFVFVDLKDLAEPHKTRFSLLPSKIVLEELVNDENS